MHGGPCIPTSVSPGAAEGRRDGPKAGGEPPATGQRHADLAGFDETDILPFGGVLEGLAAAGDARVLLDLCLPPFPIYPPETPGCVRPAPTSRD